MKNLMNKTVLITGAAGGIGLNLCSHFAEAGAKLLLVDLNQAALDNALLRLKKYKADIVTFTADQSNQKEVEALAAKILAEHGTPDVLINNAGIGYHGELANTNYDDWHKLIDVNFFGALHFIYAFLPAMRNQGAGHIVNVVTGQVFFKVPTWGAYAVSKAALATFSDILRAELAGENILVTTVYPFMVNTPFYKNIHGETLGGQLMVSLLPLYSQTPEVVAETIFDAVVNEKPVEMVSPLNYFGKYMRMSPLASGLFDKMMVLGLSKDATEGLAKNPIVQGLADSFSFVADLLKKVAPSVGFRIDEVMTGEHEFVKGYGPKGKRPMEYRVTWGPNNLIEWADPTQETFMVNQLEGTVTIDGLCSNVPCKGELQLRYLQEQKIRYVFDFSVDGKSYRYIGEKQQIYPWNLPWSHTTCFGELWELEKNEVVSRSVTHFLLDDMPEFLKSLRLA